MRNMPWKVGIPEAELTGAQVHMGGQQGLISERKTQGSHG